MGNIEFKWERSVLKHNRAGRRIIKRREKVLRVHPQDLALSPLSVARRWCGMPYDGHSKGCHMWHGRKARPCKMAEKNMNHFDDYFDRDAPMWLLWDEFDIEKQGKKIRKMHPKWTEKQCRNVRYWQRTFINGTTRDAKAFVKKKKLLGYAMLTGGFCINCFVTFRKAGLIVEPIKGIKITRRGTLIVKFNKKMWAEKRKEMLSKGGSLFEKDLP